MSTNIIYPTLNQLLPLENIPNEVESIKDAIADIFEEIFVKDLIVSKSFQGESGVFKYLEN